MTIPTYQPSEFDIRAQVACVRRELWMRKTKYPQWLERGSTKMTPEDAGKGIACMEAVLNTLEKLNAAQPPKNPELPGFKLFS